MGQTGWKDFLCPTTIALATRCGRICSLPFANSRIKEEGRKNPKQTLPSFPPSGQSPPSLPFEAGGRKSILAHEIPDLREEWLKTLCNRASPEYVQDRPEVIFLRKLPKVTTDTPGRKETPSPGINKLSRERLWNQTISAFTNYKLKFRPNTHNQRL